jgi:hypothetical protein
MTELDMANLEQMVELIPLFCLAAVGVALVVSLCVTVLPSFISWFWGER